MGRKQFCGAARLKLREKLCDQLNWLSRFAEVCEKQIISVSIYIDSTIARLIRFGSRDPAYAQYGCIANWYIGKVFIHVRSPF
jgi:hypothetical protein